MTVPKYTAPAFPAHVSDRSWRFLADDELQHYLRQYKRDAALAESAEDRAYLAMLISDAEQEWSRRLRAAELGVPIDAGRFSETFIADLKSRIMLDDLFEYECGTQFGRENAAGWRHGPCPICDSARRDCFGVYVKDASEQRYKCFACGAGGDAINAARQIYGDNFQQAIERLCKGGNVPLPAPPASTQPRHVPKKPGRVVLSDTRRGQ